jgi:peptidoglycan hydrolase-like protein with peptidoglycan-binding domain
MSPSDRRLAVFIAAALSATVAIGACSSAQREALPAAGSDDAQPSASNAPASTVSPTTVPADASSLPATSATTTTPVTTPPTTAAPTTTTIPPTTTTIDPAIEVVGQAAVQIPTVGTSSGESTRVVQERLLQLGFWHGGVDGEYGLTTRQAVMAFQKYIGIRATGEVDTDTATWMTLVSERARGKANNGTIIEIDKTRQLLFIVIDGKTAWVLNTSTGNGEEYEEPDQNTPGETVKGVSLTPDGVYEVDRERADGWWEGDLGEIYRPKYFRGGIAVHGSNSIPNYPASHGCVRVSTPAMDWIWDWNLMPIGTSVWVHGSDDPAPR